MFLPRCLIPHAPILLPFWTHKAIPIKFAGARIPPTQFSWKAEKIYKTLINRPTDAVEKLIKTVVGKLLHYIYACNYKIKSYS